MQSRVRSLSLLRVTSAWVVGCFAPALVAAGASNPAHDGIALAVVFDTSGSMTQSIPTRPGSPPSPKLEIARRAFGAVIDRLEAFARAPGAKPLSVGVYVFRGKEAAVAVPLAAFDAAKLRAWLRTAPANGATPLGSAIALAGRDILATPAASRHLLVLTDGQNSSGPTPEKTLADLNKTSLRQQRPVFTHVIALDLKPAVLAALKKQGATLIGAADEAQLNEQFDYILEEKILLEAPRAAR